jgi:hypothetical protein
MPPLHFRTLQPLRRQGKSSPTQVMAFGNTPYSKTKPFWEITINARANPLEIHQFTFLTPCLTLCNFSPFLRSCNLDAESAIQPCLRQRVIPKAL